MEQESQGLNQELLDMSNKFINKVIPRLLRPLVTGGRSIKPCLIHGDLWYGNATRDGDSDMPIIFDAASFYAHNECMLSVSLHDPSLTRVQMTLVYGELLGTRLESHTSLGITNTSQFHHQWKTEMIAMLFTQRKACTRPQNPRVADIN